MIITIAGRPGSGKNAVGEELAKKMGYSFFSAGGFFRNIAKKKRVSVFGLGEIARRNIGIDKSVDDKVVRESKKKNIVIEAHLSGFLIPKADLKVYLEADFILRSKRIARRDKSGVLKAFFELRKRDRADIKRWKKRCDFDYTNRKFYDTVIDTSGLKVMDVVGEIMKKIKGGKK